MYSRSQTTVTGKKCYKKSFSMCFNVDFIIKQTIYHSFSFIHQKQHYMLLQKCCFFPLATKIKPTNKHCKTKVSDDLTDFSLFLKLQ